MSPSHRLHELKMRNYMLFITVILALSFFFAGIIVGRSSGTRGVDDVTRLLRENELNRESFLLEQEIIVQEISQEDCGLSSQRLTLLRQELYQIGQKITDENAIHRLGEDNFRYLKVKYHLMQIKTLLLMKKSLDKCAQKSQGNPVILFYYSSDDISKEQGRILDNIVAKYNANVFAIEFNYSKDLQFMESVYNVTSTPTLIVNYNTKLSGIQSEDQLSRIINLEK